MKQTSITSIRHNTRNDKKSRHRCYGILLLLACCFAWTWVSLQEQTDWIQTLQSTESLLLSQLTTDNNTSASTSDSTSDIRNNIDHKTSIQKNQGNGSSSSEWTLLLTLNDGFYDFFANWLVYFKQIKELSHLPVIIIAEDDKVLQRLQEDPQVPKQQFTLERSKLQLRSTLGHKDTNAQQWDSPNYKKMVSTRAALILDKLAQGYHILYSDVDTVWIDNPLPYLDQLGSFDMASQTDDVPGEKTYPWYCTGFMAIRPTPPSQKTLQDWNTALQTPQLNQPVFNKIVTENKREHGFVMKELPHRQFPHGGLYFRPTYTPTQRAQAVVVHNNYIVGHDAKKKRWIKARLWKLDEHDRPIVGR